METMRDEGGGGGRGLVHLYRDDYRRPPTALEDIFLSDPEFRAKVGAVAGVGVKGGRRRQRI